MAHIPKPTEIPPQQPTSYETRPRRAPPTPTKGAPDLTQHRDTAPPATKHSVPGAPTLGAIPSPRHPPTPQGTHHRRDASNADAPVHRELTGAQCEPHSLPGEDDTARAWGRAQAAAAPRWSAAKRARMARSFGLTLPEDTPR
jgi:hypothetical protein